MELLRIIFKRMMEILWNDLIVFNEGLFVSLFLNNFIIFNMIYMYI